LDAFGCVSDQSVVILGSWMHLGVSDQSVVIVGNWMHLGVSDQNCCDFGKLDAFGCL
jgi:hypothetical protein